jgi:hypothetical protein
MDIIIAGCWSIWTKEMMLSSMDTYLIYKIKLRNYFSLNLHRAKPSLKEGMQPWLDTV